MTEYRGWVIKSSNDIYHTDGIGQNIRDRPRSRGTEWHVAEGRPLAVPTHRLHRSGAFRADFRKRSGLRYIIVKAALSLA